MLLKSISSLLQGAEKMHEVSMAQKDTALVIRNGVKQRDLFCDPDPDDITLWRRTGPGGACRKDSYQMIL